VENPGFSPYPQVLFEDRKPIPNLMICLNGPAPGNRGENNAPDESSFLPRRFILPLTVSSELFRVRNITLFGDNPPAHPDFPFILRKLSEKVEHLGVRLKPGQGREARDDIVRYAREVIYLLEPGEPRKEEADLLREDVAALCSAHRPPFIRGFCFLTGETLSSIEDTVRFAEQAQLNRLDFFPANLFITPLNERCNEPLHPGLLPDREAVSALERDFWEMLEERCFRSWLFDLNVARRQLKRVMEYFKAATGLGEFEPPHCRASRISLFIEPSGQVRFCPFQPAIGELGRHALKEIALSEPLRRFRAHHNLARNPVCPVCPGDFPHLLRRKS